MAAVSFDVIDGVDKGRCFNNLPTPITIGREEGNIVRLNDERVSRFHAKVQEDQGQVVLTDLDSTNGTTVNGDPVQLRLLRPGDRVGVGRSVLLFGGFDEIKASLHEPQTSRRSRSAGTLSDIPMPGEKAPGLRTDISASQADIPGDVDPRYDVFGKKPPTLPINLTPAQAAQLSEVIDYLHRTLAVATDPVRIPPEAREARLPLENWHRIQAVLAILAQYSRRVSEPQDGFDFSQ